VFAAAAAILCLFLGLQDSRDAACASQVDLGSGRPDLQRLFTPLRAPEGTYEVRTTPRPIGELAGRLRACDPKPAPGAWTLTRPESHDAFGRAGIYDRFKLAQLFGGRRVTVARGSLPVGDGHIAYTLISPYPNAALDRLENGTMVILIRTL
jgi:hypothetical protein